MILESFKNHSKVYFVLSLGFLCAFLFFIQFIANDAQAQINEAVRIGKKIYIKATQVVKPESTIKLNVKFHKQEHSLSCEIAALKMALNYRGVIISEDELLKILPFAQPRERKNNVWGDPNLGFVGKIDGKMPNTGYGVYAKPILEIAKKYRAASMIENAGLNDLINELSNKNPIVVWTVIGPEKDISWKTPEGKKIKAYQIEHAQVVIGFTGSQDNIKKIILLDPVYGEVYWDKQYFLRKWSMLDRQAIVIK